MAASLPPSWPSRALNEIAEIRVVSILKSMNRADPDWNLYRSFLGVLQEGSLSAAARSLGLTQPTLARHIDALEAAVGFQLFTRSQQGLTATEGALELKPYAESLAATTAALLRNASGQGQTVKGAVRVSASEIVGAEVLPPILARLREDHPSLEFELVLSNTIDNLLRRDVDIAVRMVEPAQEALVVRRLGEVTLGLYAHRRYLDRSGEPRDLSSLRAHSIVGYDRETPAIRAMRQRAPGLDGIRFALRTDSDIAHQGRIRHRYLSGGTGATGPRARARAAGRFCAPARRLVGDARKSALNATLPRRVRRPRRRPCDTC